MNKRRADNRKNATVNPGLGDTDFSSEYFEGLDVAWAGEPEPSDYEPMRVLFVLSSGTADGGAAQVWLNLLHGLQRYGVEPFVVVPDNGDGTMVERLTELGIPYLELFYTWWVTTDPNPHSLRRRTVRKVARIANERAEAELEAALEGIDLDLVYLADGTITLGLDVAARRGIPVVWQFHQFIRGQVDGISFIDEDAEVAAQLARAERILTVTAGQREDLCRRFALDPSKVRAVYNGIDFERLANKVSLLSGEQVVFTIAGRIDANKRQMDAVEAFERIAPDFPQARLAIVGKGADADLLALISRVEASPYQDRIELTGYRADMWTVWGATDVALNCSMSEGCSMVVAEAMASGCLVIASSAEGNAELLDPDSAIPGMYEGLRGLLYERGNIADLAAQMRWVLENPQAARQIAANGRADARQAFDPARQLRTIRQVFDEATDR